MKRKVFTFLVLLLMIGTLPNAAAFAAGKSTLRGSAPAWANSRNLTGAADPNGGIGFRVYLGWKDQAGAEALARSVSDPTSSSYGKYLTPAQFRRQFAPTQSNVGAVQSWLKSQGFSIVYTPTN